MFVINVYANINIFQHLQHFEHRINTRGESLQPCRTSRLIPNIKFGVHVSVLSVAWDDNQWNEDSFYFDLDLDFLSKSDITQILVELAEKWYVAY